MMNKNLYENKIIGSFAPATNEEEQKLRKAKARVYDAVNKCRKVEDIEKLNEAAEALRK